ncbi:MAG TPA: ABC transporter permease, partial [Lachnospiraceae bacterium]|nr:ABC transporter permease [Lachnospiraceae bacterium]
MSTIFTISILQSAIELGFIYSLVVLALFISFSILNIADLSTDGCFTLGCAVAASMTLAGHPVLALFAALGAGVLSGFVTSFLQTRLGVESILAGIIVNTGLYTINIAVMGFSSNLNLFKCDSIFTMARDFIQKNMGEGAFEVLVTGGWYRLILVAVLVIIIGILLSLFLGTRLGLSIRATGDNAAMVKASSINPKHTITVGLCVSGAMTALSGGILAQYQKSCDINLGTGMVTIALASLIIGETLIGKGTMFRRIVGVIFGSCLYRFIVAVAIRINVPAECLKLVSALIVA